MRREIHDPRHIAQLAAVLLSSQPFHEQDIKGPVHSARNLLDEAFLRAEKDEAMVAAAEQAAKEEAEKPAESADGEDKS